MTMTSLKSSPPTVSQLLETIDAKGKLFTDGDSDVRRDLLATARSLCLALETPFEQILHMNWADPSRNAVICIGINLNLFEKLAEHDGSPKSLSDLATWTKAEPVFLSRILKQLAATGVIHEADVDEYSPTPLANALTIPASRDCMLFCNDTSALCFPKMSKFFASTQYKDPTNALDTPFQYTFNTKLHMFGWLAENPKAAHLFHSFMGGYSFGRALWMDPGCVPVDGVLGDGAKTDKDAVLLVDVGGGNGHDITAFHKVWPQLPGRLILQDQPDVIAKLSGLPTEIEPTAHDFFTPQPVKGARAYYLHSVLHNWSDDKCRDILKNLILAMTKGYSKILINENVIPSKGASWQITSLDMIMMSFYGSSERTEQAWNALLESVGLKVNKIWTYEVGTPSLIEAELA